MQNSCGKKETLNGEDYAGFWVRLAAYAIDSAVVFAGLLIVRLVFAGISLTGGDGITGTDILFHYSLKDMVLYFLKVLYFVAFTYLTGTTLGKKAMNLCVVSRNPEEKLTLVNVIYRETVGRYLCSLPVNIGYIVAGIDSEKRGFHDMLCDTRVVYMKKVKIWPVQENGNTEISPTPETATEENLRAPEITAEEKMPENVVVKQEEQGYNTYHLVNEQNPEK